MFTGTLLSWLIWLPVFGAILVLLSGNERNSERAKIIALLTTVVSMGLCVPLVTHFDAGNAAMQFVESHSWIPALNINYAIGVDGIAVALIVLTAFTNLIVVLAAFKLVREHVAQYLAAFLFLQGAMTGVFAAMDAILFYVFWEAMLIPMYLVIGVWGSQNRSYAAIKFFLYTFLGSAMMLAALLYLAQVSGQFAIDSFYIVDISLAKQIAIFAAFFLAFAVKIPMVPVHTWLPDAHTEAPAGGSVILAAIMLKMGAYGFLRFIIPIVPDACRELAPLMIILSLVAIVYIGLVAISQKDMKRLIAYSSIAHMGIVTLGCFLFFMPGTVSVQEHMIVALDGAVVQMISHAFSSGAMFIAVGMVYDRLHTRMIKDYGGVAKTMPVLASFFMLFAMANVGLPATSGFVGEFMVIISAFQVKFMVAFLAATTLILAAAYTLSMYKRVFFGEIHNQAVAALQDVSGVEWVVLLLLAIPILAIGIYPSCLLRIFHESTMHIMHLGQVVKL